MKKAFILALCAMSLTALQAQQMYLKLSAGAGMGTATGDTRSEEITASGGKTTYTVGSGSYGAGAQFGFAAGYSLNDHIDLELGGQYLMGFAQKEVEEDNDGSTTGKDETSTYTRQWRVIPQVIFKIGDSDFQPYTRFGLIVPVAGRTFTQIISSYTYSGTTNETEATLETSGAFSIGWTSGLGVRKALGDRSFFFADLGFQSLSIGAKKSETTVYKSNGRDVLVDLETYEKEIEYVKKYTDGETFNANEPSTMLRTWSPFSNLALTVGLQINL